MGLTTTGILPGGTALSSFRQARLRAALQAVVPTLTQVTARWVYLVQTQPLTAALHVRLAALLDAEQVPLVWDASCLLVTPRLGTRSPWSSKATDIAAQCGLTPVLRIERATAYQLTVASLTTSQRQTLAALLHDRMTESVLDDLAQVADFFTPPLPAPLAHIDFLAQGMAALEAANRSLGLALNLQELEYLAASYSQLRRNPTDAELMMFAQANSEHCRHKIFNAQWTLDGQPQAGSLFGMIRHTAAVSPQGLISAYHDNAAVIAGHPTARFGIQADGHYGYLTEATPFLLKVETHNHPTAIAPFPGAATGVGGEIRDEAATGRGARSLAGLSGFVVSDLQIPDAPQPWERARGKPERLASALEIMLHGPIGAAAFNNEFGRPSLAGFFRTYSQETPDGRLLGYHKPIMLAGGVGQIRPMLTHKAAVPPGALLIVLGGPALLIGLGGGAASSVASGASSAALDFASVQRGNPEMQRRCQEVIERCYALGEANPILSLHDVGAGGLANALPELVHDAGRGAQLDLRQIPTDDLGLSPLALWCNEAQERYVLALAAPRRAEFVAICERERCPYAVLGVATEAAQLKLLDSANGQSVVDLPLAVLLGKLPKMQRVAVHGARLGSALACAAIIPAEAAQRVLQLPAVASKQFLITIGDRTVGGLSARDQLVGPWQTPTADVAVSCAGFTTTAGVAFALGERPPVAVLSPKASARLAVGEALTNLAAAAVGELGVVKLSANWMAAAGVPGEDAGLWDAVQAVALELCPALGIAIPVGKDSLSMNTVWALDGQTQQVSSPLSLVITAVTPVADVTKTATPLLHAEGDIWLIDLGLGQNRLGGSALAQVYASVGATPADLDDPALLRSFWRLMQALHAQDGWLLAYHDRSDGGLFAAACELSFTRHCGLGLALDGLGADPLASLFSEELGALLQISTARQAEFWALVTELGLAACTHRLGAPCAAQTIQFTWQGCSYLAEERVVWQRLWARTSYTLQVLRDNPACAQEEYDALLAVDAPGLSIRAPVTALAAPLINLGVRPQVAILREQGVNGHHEMAAAFDSAGFDAVDVHMSDLRSGRYQLQDFTGLAACGGFSYGDVLGAGVGWARAILYNPRLRDMFAAFFAHPDRFALGVCNGCQMLSQLNALIPGAESWPQFGRNTSEQFEARLVMAEVLPSPSLFFAGMAGTCAPIVVAHGEGRAVFASQAQLHAVQQQGLVSLRYVDPAGAATERYPYNPNGSPQGLTALTTPPGRVTLLMPHPERLFRRVQYSYLPLDWKEPSPWMHLFHNARRHVS